MPAWFVAAIVLLLLGLVVIGAAVYISRMLKKALHPSANTTENSTDNDSETTSDQGTFHSPAAHTSYGVTCPPKVEKPAPQPEIDIYRVGNLKKFRLGATVLGGFFLLLSAIFTTASSYSPVSTKNVGIITSFGRPSGSLDNGVHWIAPWKKVTELDAAIQTDNYEQKTNNCVYVRVAYQATGCVDVSVRWRIDPNQADTLFQNYKDFDNIRASLVTRELNQALSSNFASYDPLATDANGTPTAPSYATISGDVKTTMVAEIQAVSTNGAANNQQVQPDVDVQSVTVTFIHFDDSIQGRINSLQGQVAQTRIAQQSELTAQAKAKANQILAGSLANNPNVLISQCLDEQSDAIAKGYQLPAAGFNCFGGGSTVVVPSAK